MFRDTVELCPRPFDIDFSRYIIWSGDSSNILKEACYFSGGAEWINLLLTMVLNPLSRTRRWISRLLR